MPALINQDTPTKEMTISGMKFMVPQPYSAGHTLDENEAEALNGLLGENVRNNFTGRIKKMTEERNGVAPSQEELAPLLFGYAVDYEFGVRRSSTTSQPADPVEREAYNLAKDTIKVALKSRNIALKDVSSEKLQELIDGLLKSRPEIRAEAERRVAAQASMSAIELDLPAPAPKPEATAEASEGTTETEQSEAAQQA